MISNEDKTKLLEIAGRYGVSKLYLFGSSVHSEGEPRDIDLAVDGIPDKLFFEFYGELIFALSKPVDLIDLKRSNPFNEMVKSEGVLLYG